MQGNSVPQKTKPATGIFVQRASGDTNQHTALLAAAKRNGPDVPKPGVTATTVNQPGPKKVSL